MTVVAKHKYKNKLCQNFKNNNNNSQKKLIIVLSTVNIKLKFCLQSSIFAKKIYNYI